jgi:hypothetical protein
LNKPLPVSLNKTVSKLSRWREHGGALFLQTQLRRVGLGFLIGATVGIAVRLSTRDHKFAPLLHRSWLVSSFDGIGAYRAELILLSFGVIVIALPPTITWFWRYARAWWAGITSFVVVFVGWCVLVGLTYWPSHPSVAATVGLVTIAAFMAIELWRQKKRPASVAWHDLVLNIPIKKSSGSGELRWRADTSNDPITDWNDDIIGRAGLVELLAEHALHLRTPIVALRAGLGDGKTSVLNLFRNAIKEHAIVVSFNAWLPGSEATLASRHMKLFMAYYHESRVHLSLAKDTPEPRPVHRPELGPVVAIPQVGGLHHRYERRAA